MLTLIRTATPIWLPWPAMTREGLKSRGLISERDEQSPAADGDFGLKLKDHIGKRAQNQPLIEEEYELIRSIGGQLEHFLFGWKPCRTRKGALQAVERQSSHASG